MAEQGLMAPLPLILQPCSDSYQSNVEASLPDLLSIQVRGLHIQRCNDEIAQCISAHLLLVQHRAGHVQQMHIDADHTDFAGCLQGQHNSACHAMPGCVMT